MKRLRPDLFVRDDPDWEVGKLPRGERMRVLLWATAEGKLSTLKCGRRTYNGYEVERSCHDGRLWLVLAEGEKVDPVKVERDWWAVHVWRIMERVNVPAEFAA